jgi:hypothetical protein
MVELWPTDSPAGAAPVSAGGLLLQVVRKKAQRDSNNKSFGAEGRGCKQSPRWVLSALDARVRMEEFAVRAALPVCCGRPKSHKQRIRPKQEQKLQFGWK